MTRMLWTRRAMAGLVVILAVAGCASGSTTILSKVGASVGEPAAAPGASFAPAPDGGNAGRGGEQGGSNGAFRDEAKIIRTGSMSLQVNDLAVAVRTAREAVRVMGGYVAGSRETNDGDQSVAEITYRIPSDRWDDSLDAIRKTGKVLTEHTGAVEVTGQLVDLEARIANLRATEKAFQVIAAQATKIPDIIEVQNQLSNVRGQIEQLDAQRAHLSDQAGYGTLGVTFGVQVAAVTEAAKGWNPGAEIDNATASLVNVLQALTSAGIWFAIVWLPILLMVGGIVALVAYVLRRTGVLSRPEPPTTPAPAA